MSEPFVEKVRVVTEFLNSIGNLDFDAVGEHLAENAVMVLPFVDGLSPVHGKDAIVDQLRGSIPQMFERMNFAFDDWYNVCDTDTLIAEYHSECPQKGTGTIYKNSYITVFRFEDEKINLYREYLNPSRIFAAVSPAESAAES
jgi:ketosteroid isomerase-like protein